MLTQRQITFANEYIATGNASEAYRRAYPRSLKWKASAVEQNASHLLKNTKVSARVDELREKAQSAAVATRQELLETLTRIVRATPGQFLKSDGSIDLEKLKEAKQEVESIEMSEGPMGAVKYKFRVRDVIAAADRLARMEGWDAPTKHDHTSGGKTLAPAGRTIITFYGDAENEPADQQGAGGAGNGG